MGGGRPDYLPDGNSADGKVSFLITADCHEDPASLLGLETKFYPYRLTEYDYSEGVEETFDFVGGHWTTDLTITLSEQASGFVQSVGQPLTVEGDDPFSDSVWNDLGISSVALVTQSGETILMAEQVYGTAAGEPKNGLPGYGYTFIQMGERPERVFDPAEIASITIFGQTFPLDGLVPVES